MTRLLLSAFMAFLLITALSGFSQNPGNTSYCNPINIDYTYMIYNADEGLSYRSGADPAVVQFRNAYYMFVTRSLGYWYSKDLLHWKFITPENWYFQGSNAPAAHNYKDSVLYVAGDPSGAMSVLHTSDPVKGDWKAAPFILKDLQDPDLFIDDNGDAYMFWGSSNIFPIRGMKLDRNNSFKPVSPTDTLFNLNATDFGWERFGQNNTDTIGGYIEGPWLTKDHGTYYMQYAAPGTEFNVYGDGVYVGASPLGPYHYAPNNPVSFKPGGFINGAGHGSTVKDKNNHYWHFTTMAVGVNVGWERRIGMFPAGFDKDGLMYCHTYFGDYPHYAPDKGDNAGKFRGWMLLSYKKPVTASSTLGSYGAANINDEDVKTFWVAEKNDDSQWVEIDLIEAGSVHAIQVNYNDYHSGLYGRVPGLHQQYLIEGSMDRKKWFPLIDKRNNLKDVPNDYTELSTPLKARYIRFKNTFVPTPYLSLSDIRVFGTGSGARPGGVKDFKVKRMEDSREALLTWERNAGCQGYNILWGIAPDKLYSSWMVYGNNSLTMRNLDRGRTYYFSIEAFNENGISQRISPVKVE